MSTAKLFPWSSFAWIALTLPTLPAIAHNDDNGGGNSREQTAYESKVLVSNGGIPANFTDPNLINGWGVAFNPNGFVWVNAADAGKAVLYDGKGQPQSLVVTVPGPGGFADPKLPKLYAPFGIQAIGGDIYVTYAKQEEAGGDEEEQGAGLGIVNVFDPEGNLIRRVATRGPLNAPWGIALAPASFGSFGGALLIGNLGDGTINAFGPRSGKFLGSLQAADHKPLHVDGLWGMQFGNGISNQETNALFWAAGPNDESDGAYGVISAVSK